jgi:tetratricopeptide (TPR) repeat protein
MFAADHADAAEPTVEEARRFFREAVALDDAGDTAGALALYRKARAVVVSPELLYDIGSCEERLGHPEEARQAYEEARDEAQARGNAEVLREANERLSHLKTASPRIVVIVPPVPTFVPKSDTPLAPPAVRPRPSYVPAVAAGGVSVALAAASAVTFAVGRGKKDDYEALNSHPLASTEAERHDLKSSGETLYVASTVLGVGAVLAGSAAVYFFVRAALAPNSARAATWVVPSPTGLSWRGLL